MRLLLLKVVDMFSRGRDQTIFKENGILSFTGSSDGKESACNLGDPGSIPGWEDPLEKGMATHSSILAWEIPWTGEPGRL